MAYFEFPHTRNYDGDLGWVIKKIIELTERYNDFFEYNKITFADPLQWDITKQYPPYQIVFDYDQGYSYISKRPVPAGVTITNPDYWVLVGPLIVDAEARTEISRILNFICNIYEPTNIATAVRAAGEYVIIGDGHLYKTTAVINIGEGYTEGINVTPITIETMIGEIVDTMRPIDNALDVSSTNAVENGVVTAAINGLRTDLNNVTDAVDLLTDHHYICISDSYGQTPSEAGSWIGCLQSYMNIPNDHFWRNQYGGSGFAGVNDHPFEVLLSEVAGTMTTEEKESITDIIIGGGFNDANAIRLSIKTDNDVRTAINSCLAYIRLTFPNAKTYVFMPGWGIDKDYHAMLRGIINIYQQTIMENEKVSYIDGVNWLHRYALLDSTLFHPNAVGATCIAKSIASVLNGGTVFCDMGASGITGYVTPTATAIGANVSTFSMIGAQQLYSEGNATFLWRSIKFTPIAAIADGGAVEVATFTDGIMSGGAAFEGYSGTVIITGGKHSILAIYDNKLVFFNLSGATLPANTEINIYINSITGSIML